VVHQVEVPETTSTIDVALLYRREVLPAATASMDTCEKNLGENTK